MMFIILIQAFFFFFLSSQKLKNVLYYTYTMLQKDIDNRVSNIIYCHYIPTIYPPFIIAVFPAELVSHCHHYSIIVIVV